MLAKQNVPISKEKKNNISPSNASKLNKLSEDFGKCFVLQMQLSAEQAFWLPLLNPNSEQLVVTQTLVKSRFLKNFQSELNEVKMVFNQMEAAVEQCSVDKKYFDIQKKELCLDNDRLLDHIIFQDVMNIVMHVDFVHVNVVSFVAVVDWFMVNIDSINLDLDALRSRTSQLKNQDYVDGTKDVGGSLNVPPITLHAEGDNHGVSSFAGHVANKIHVVPSFANESREHTSYTTLNAAPTSFGESTPYSLNEAEQGEFTNLSSLNTNGPNLNSNEYIRPTSWTLGDQSKLPSEINNEIPMVQSVDINMKPTSYAGAAVFDDVNISKPHKVFKKVIVRFDNTLYGYFIGKRMAFSVVQYYARNNWAKHGLKRIIMNAKGIFFFKFDTRAGLDAVLEGGPWMIRNSLIILKKWSMKTSLQKEELTHILIWVKLHDVPIQVFEEDGISLIAIYLSKPIMLDSYTSAMC
ncbi:zinc knuckle CX2CX4HX4C containing protein [Tanacetum coccineum]